MDPKIHFLLFRVLDAWLCSTWDGKSNEFSDRYHMHLPCIPSSIHISIGTTAVSRVERVNMG